jgi:hypothetical protein
MAANEAKELALLAAKQNLTPIFNRITSAARIGDFSINYPLENREAKFADEIIKELRTFGYETNRVQGYDQRDGDSWDYLTISWE